MKRYFIICLCLALSLSSAGCKPMQSQTVEADLSDMQSQPAGGTENTDSAVISAEEAQSAPFDGEFVEVIPPCLPSYGITFLLPEDWTYETIVSADAPTSDLVVSIRPDREGMEGAISISYSKGFGVCGTGLEQKEIVFNGHSAWQGFYDGRSVWNFIVLKDPKDCVIINGAGDWFGQYEQQIEQILSTVEFVYYETLPDFSGSDPMAQIIDTASFDIDGDGISEGCVITTGPTSGLYSIVITASVDGKIKYRNTFVFFSWGAVSFGEQNGTPCIIMERYHAGQEPVTEYHGLFVENGKIMIEGLDRQNGGYWDRDHQNDDLENQSPDEIVYYSWDTTRLRYYESLEELWDASEVIITGTCIRSEPAYQLGQIYTLSEVRIEESYKGGLFAGDTIQVLELGGRDSYGAWQKNCNADEKDFPTETYPENSRVVIGTDGFYPMKEGESVLLFLVDSTGFLKGVGGTLYYITGDTDGKLYLRETGVYQKPDPSPNDTLVFSDSNLTVNPELLKAAQQ